VLRFVRDNRQLPSLADDLAEHAARFECVRRSLRPGDTVGYFGRPGSWHVRQYYLAQFALAPVVVRDTLAAARILESEPGREPPPGFRRIVDCGNAVGLLEPVGK
jgi:hypothetical protein